MKSRRNPSYMEVVLQVTDYAGIRYSRHAFNVYFNP